MVLCLGFKVTLCIYGVFDLIGFTGFTCLSESDARGSGGPHDAPTAVMAGAVDFCLISISWALR